MSDSRSFSLPSSSPPPVWYGVAVPVIIVTPQGQILDLNPLADRLLTQSVPHPAPCKGQAIDRFPVLFPPGTFSWETVQHHLQHQGQWDWEVQVSGLYSALRWVAQIIHSDIAQADSDPVQIILTGLPLLPPALPPEPIVLTPNVNSLDISQVVAMLSHEYRTPLTTILMSAELLEQYGQDWSVSRCLTHYRRIHDAAQDLTGLVDRILLITRANAGHIEVHFHQVDVATFLKRIIASVQSPDPTAKEQILLELPPKLPTLWTDSQLLSPILHNLLSNAIKYTPSPDRFPVKIRVWVEDSSLTIAVEDQGIGIPVEDQKCLFHSFHRAANVGDIAGMGLGLVIASRCTALLQGTLQFQSTIGKGSTFQVGLPLRDFSEQTG